MSSEHTHHDYGDEPGHGEGGGHGSVAFYSFIALVLCVITGIEVAVLYPPLSAMPDALKVACLIGLSVVKFITVVAFFMHLYFDHPLMTFLFVSAMVLATGTMVGLIHVVPEAEHSLTPRSKEEIKKQHEAAAKQHAFASPEFEQRMAQWRALQG